MAGGGVIVETTRQRPQASLARSLPQSGTGGDGETAGLRAVAPFGRSKARIRIPAWVGCAATVDDANRSAELRRHACRGRLWDEKRVYWSLG